MSIIEHVKKFLMIASLRAKFLLGILSIVFFLGAAIVFFVQTTLSQKLIEELQKRGATIAKSIAKESTELVLTDRYVDLQLLINSYLGAEEDIEYIFIQGPGGSILAHTFQGLFPSDLKNANEVNSTEATGIQPVILDKINILDFAVKILHGGEWVVRVGISEEPIKRNVNYIVSRILLIILAVVLIGSGAAVAYSYVITRPISELTMVARAVAKGDLDQKVRIRTRDEIGELSAVFNNMIAERKNAEDSMLESERKLRSITDTAIDSIILIDNKGCISYWNPSAERMFGYSKEEIENKNISVIIPEKYREEHLTAFYRFSGTGHIIHLGGKAYQTTALRKNGKEFPIELSVSGVMLQGRWHAAGIIRDITDRKHLEGQLLHIQKMEAIGTLSGGIAHDFNNILNIIIGYADITLRAIKEDDPLRPNLDEILSAAERAAHLTKSMLAFARKQVYDPKPENLNDIVFGMKKMLSRIIGEDIELKTIITDRDLIVLADSSQIEQVLMNLATNAKAAMKGGGKLIIETDFAEMDAAFLNTHGYGNPGKYSLISVSDSGSGMDEETREKIFEPFFTTKGVGEGTGLGLSIVYGIIKQHNGFINVYSEPGSGTTFRIYLPAIETECQEAETEIQTQTPGGTETLLLAEDDMYVRKLTQKVLQDAGYKVIAAVDGNDAIEKFNHNKEDIQLILLDMVMPKKNGKESFRYIRKIKPDVKCIFLSGHAEDLISKRVHEKEVLFISKPVSPTNLLKTVREVLDNESKIMTDIVS